MCNCGMLGKFEYFFKRIGIMPSCHYDFCIRRFLKFIHFRNNCAIWFRIASIIEVLFSIPTPTSSPSEPSLILPPFTKKNVSSGFMSNS